MMICSSCSACGGLGDKYCGWCGAELVAARCDGSLLKRCGYVFASGDKHCRKCGKVVPAKVQKALMKKDNSYVKC